METQNHSETRIKLADMAACAASTGANRRGMPEHITPSTLTGLPPRRHRAAARLAQQMFDAAQTAPIRVALIFPPTAPTPQAVIDLLTCGKMQVDGAMIDEVFCQCLTLLVNPMNPPSDW